MTDHGVVLVTGGAGFIGSHLVRALVHRGARVRVLDNGLAGPLSSTRSRLRDVRSAIEFIDGDVCDQAVVRRACAGAEIVFHHAAVASVPASVADPEMTHAVNVTGTLTLLQAARAAGVRRVVFASSSAVYGTPAKTPTTETLPTLPSSPYGVQKLAAEGYTRIWHALYGLETVALRYFNVFGPAQDPASEYAAVIPRFISAALNDTAPTIFGDGEQSRDFIYVQNVVDINLLAASRPEAVGQVINVGTGTAVTLNQLVGELRHILGRPTPVHYAPARPGDIRESRADIAHLQSLLDYTPRVSLRTGLEETIHALDLTPAPISTPNADG